VLRDVCEGDARQCLCDGIAMFFALKVFVGKLTFHAEGTKKEPLV
jgi:hypothetical protein